MADFDLNALFQQAQQIQEQMRDAQERLAQKTVTGSAGGGMVVVTANGKGEIQRVQIDKQAVDPRDVPMLEDLVLAAVNSALKAGAGGGGGGESALRDGRRPGRHDPGLSEVTDPIARLTALLARLPGVGEKTAQRLAFHVLKSPPEYARDLAEALLALRQEVRLCSTCCNLTAQDPCAICRDGAARPAGDLRGGDGAATCSPSSARASSAAATTSCTARSRRSTASVPTS